MRLSVMIDGRRDTTGARQVATLVARLGLDGVWWRQPPHLGRPAADLPALVETLAATGARVGVVTDGDVDGVAWVPAVAGRDLDEAVRAVGGAGLPLVVEVPMSVGRTAAEAYARAEREKLFAVIGHPAEAGLFGTLEQCQAEASRLAHMGVAELVCCPPGSADLPDVLAQVRTIAIGAAALRPGEPPSDPPPPPVGWGGRRTS